jgi:hypothetical protein
MIDVRVEVYYQVISKINSSGFIELDQNHELFLYNTWEKSLDLILRTIGMPT